jgi:hypothetical protein
VFVIEVRQCPLRSGKGGGRKEKNGRRSEMGRKGGGKIK